MGYTYMYARLCNCNVFVLHSYRPNRQPLQIGGRQWKSLRVIKWLLSWPRELSSRRSHNLVVGCMGRRIPPPSPLSIPSTSTPLASRLGVYGSLLTDPPTFQMLPPPWPIWVCVCLSNIVNHVAQLRQIFQCMLDLEDWLRSWLGPSASAVGIAIC